MYEDAIVILFLGDTRPSRGSEARFLTAFKRRWWLTIAQQVRALLQGLCQWLFDNYLVFIVEVLKADQSGATRRHELARSEVGRLGSFNRSANFLGVVRALQVHILETCDLIRLGQFQTDAFTVAFIGRRYSVLVKREFS